MRPFLRKETGKGGRENSRLPLVGSRRFAHRFPAIDPAAGDEGESVSLITTFLGAATPNATATLVRARGKRRPLRSESTSCPGCIADDGKRLNNTRGPPDSASMKLPKSRLTQIRKQIRQPGHFHFGMGSDFCTWRLDRAAPDSVNSRRVNFGAASLVVARRF